MSNIAICISGQPRYYEKGIEFFNKNISAEYDIFIHTWLGDEGIKLDPSHYKDDKLVHSAECIKGITNGYRPISITIEKPKRFSDNIRTNNYLSQMYSIQESNNLKIKYENYLNQKYDFVVRMRFDWAWGNIIPFCDLDRNILYAIDSNRSLKGNNKHINDQFFVCNSRNMDKLLDTHDKVKNDYISHGEFICGPEDILYKSIEMNNIPIKELPWTHIYGADMSVGMSIDNSIIRR